MRRIGGNGTAGEAKGHVAVSGYHTESGRLAHLGSLTNHAVSSEGGCEVHTWLLTPSEFSGDYKVEITVDGTTVDVPFEAKVPGLEAVEESDTILPYQSQALYEQIHTGHYHLTPGFKSIVESIAEQYNAEFPGTRMYLNDCSLEWGGRFEYQGYWTGGSHSRHRRGLEADINKVGSSGQQIWLRDFIDDAEGAKVDHESAGHWHVQPPPQ